jgi:hypothetical protein
MKTGFSLGSAREGAVQGFKGYNTVGTVGMARSACLAEFDQMATERERPALFAVIISQFTGFFGIHISWYSRVLGQPGEAMRCRKHWWLKIANLLTVVLFFNENI